MEPIRAAELALTRRDVLRSADRFGIADIESIGGYENALYKATQPEGCVLRITHTSRRSVGLVAAEFSYIEHLATHGVPVVAPIRSRNGLVAEEMATEAGETVVVACMSEAQGEFRPGSEWSDREITVYGSVLGRLHSAAATYVPPEGVDRPGWTDPVFDVGFQSTTDSEMGERWDVVRTAAMSHPAGAQDLLIHQDAHLGNLFITDAGTITLFDFDDCGYGTRTHDVAIALFYWVWKLPMDRSGEARRFLDLFLAGYRRHGELPEGWEEGADRILKVREFELYYLLSEEGPVAARDESFMRDRQRRVLEGIPMLDVPLAEIMG
jgi:Ser/Thr protein kinase RdoA (MazF antagonist)